MGVEKILILCDFDGTASTVDVGNELLDRFTGDGWKDIDRDYCDGKIGSRIAYTRIAPLFRGNRAQMLAYVFEKSTLDPFFADFYTYCRRMGMDLKIISDGLDFYIEAILKKNGLSEIEFFPIISSFRIMKGFPLNFPRPARTAANAGIAKAGSLNNTGPYMTGLFISETAIPMSAPQKMPILFLRRKFSTKSVLTTGHHVFIIIIFMIFSNALRIKSLKSALFTRSCRNLFVDLDETFIEESYRFP